MMGGRRDTAWVVVLGDFGRSPRMQYHAISLLQTTRYDVRVIAFFGNGDGIRPELTCEAFQGRVKFSNVPALCAPLYPLHASLALEVLLKN